MKKAICAILLLSLLVAFCACGKGTEDQLSTQMTTQATEPTQPFSVPEHTEPPETQPAPVYVYENAVEDYLLPIEEFSWEREYAPEYVMIHFTSAVMTHREDPYDLNYVRQTFVDYDVSVHYIIERDGTVHCYIPEDRVAWHAGKGQWKDDPKYTNKMNYYAIGIELIGMGSEEDMSIYMSAGEYRKLDSSLKCFTPEQYSSLKALVTDICDRNNIPMDRDHVIGHEDYSPTKNDPGQLFDWDRLMNKWSDVL